MDSITKYRNIKNMYNGLNILYIFGKDDVFNYHEISKEDIKYAKVAIAMLNLIFTKEDIVENTGNLIYKSKVDEHYLEQIVLQISKKTKEGYQIGEYVFSDAPTLFAGIRNSLAHGSFEIIGNKVCLYKENKKMPIDIEKLSQVCFKITSQLKLVKNKKDYKRYILLANDNLEEFNKGEESYKIIKLLFFKEDNSDLTINDTKLIEEEMRLFSYTIDRLLKESPIKLSNEEAYRFAYKMTEDKLKENGITFKENYIMLDSKNKKKIMDFTKKLYPFGNADIRTIAMFLYEMVDNDKPKLNIINGCNYNCVLFSYIEENKYKNLKFADIIKSGIENDDNFIYSNDVREVTTLITMFMAVYGYPLDDLYKNEDVLNRLDFSKLDLSMIKPKVNKYNTNQLERFEVEYNNALKLIESTNKKIEDKLEQLNHIKKEETKEIVKSDILSIKNTLEELIVRGFEKQRQYFELKEEYESRELYYINRNIIEGIRNSLAHGNVTINRLVDSPKMEDTEITFINNHDGVEWFNLTIKLSDFESIVSEENINHLFEFCENKKIKK